MAHRPSPTLRTYKRVLYSRPAPEWLQNVPKILFRYPCANAISQSCRKVHVALLLKALQFGKPSSLWKPQDPSVSHYLDKRSLQPSPQGLQYKVSIVRNELHTQRGDVKSVVCNDVEDGAISANSIVSSKFSTIISKRRMARRHPMTDSRRYAWYDRQPYIDGMVSSGCSPRSQTPFLSS